MRDKNWWDPERLAGSYSEPELLLALRAIVSSGAEFSEAIEQIERRLVEAGVCSGLVVLEVRCRASFPIAGTGGRVPSRLSGSIVSRDVRAATRNVRVVFLRNGGSTRRITWFADFVAEQLSELLMRASLPRSTRIAQNSITRRIVTTYTGDSQSPSTKELA